MLSSPTSKLLIDMDESQRDDHALITIFPKHYLSKKNSTDASQLSSRDIEEIIS